MLRKILSMVILFATFIFIGCGSQVAINGETHVEAAQNDKGNLKISMLKVGHGDAILIQTGKQTILVDTTNVKKHDWLVEGLEKFSVTKIDKLILTHPHGDHIGGAKMLIDPSQEELTAYPYLKKISVAAVYDNGIVHTSKLYKNYLKAIKTKKITHKSLKAGDTLNFGNGVKFNVLSPTAEFVATVNDKKFDKKDRAYNVNNGSIVGRLTYKKFSMMFTGDCEKESEAKIVANNKPEDLKCDVLKSGHHGISTSSTKNFVAAINPSHVLISSAKQEKDNVAIGFPTLGVLKNYLAKGIDKKNIYCTRFNGTITITSDGKTFSVTPEIKEDWVDKWLAIKKEEWKKKQQKK